MKDKNKIKLNLVVGILGQGITLLLGILVPRFILKGYGSEINGLLSSVTNIYSYIAIVEAGVAAAACQALYKAIANENQNKINEILSATHIFYKRTGWIYTAFILLFTLIYPLLITTDIPYFTVVLVVLFNGIGNVVNYFFHGKYMLLLKADGKQYIRTGIEVTLVVIRQCSKIVLIACGCDVVFVQLAAMLASFLQMLFVSWYINKNYKWIDLKAKPDFSALANSKHVLAHEINYMITGNIDTLLLTIFTTLKTVSVYSVYAMLFGMIAKVLRTIKDSLEFKIANVFHNDMEQFNKLFQAYEVYYIAFAFSLFTIANRFVLPFLELYTDGVADADYLNAYLPYLFVAINLVETLRYPSDALVYITGHFQQTKASAWIETAINLSGSVILIQFVGIYGVLLGTVISLAYRAVYLITYVNRKIIGRTVRDTYRCFGLCVLLYILINSLGQLVKFKCTGYLSLFLMVIPYSLCVCLLFFVFVSVFFPKSFQFLRDIVRR